MNILLGISLSNKNFKFLDKFLKSLIDLETPNDYFVKFVFIVEKKNLRFSNIIQKRLNRKNFEVIFSDNHGIPQSRNLFLKYLRKHKSIYAGFFDDDCIIPRKWLRNMIKFINKTRSDIVGGPQLHKVKNKFYLKLFNLIEPSRKHAQKVDWVATNNVFFKSKILIDNNIFFDDNLRNIGGSDQLFFKKLNHLNFTCRWNTTSKVIENIQSDRENILWFLKRNLRYGYSGNYIDKSVYGNLLGNFIIIFKITYLLFISFIFIFLFFKENNFYQTTFYFIRSIGRILGLLNYIPKKYI